MSRENDSVIFKLLKSADVINDGTQEISQQFDGESYPKLPDANMLELGEIALNIAKDYEVIAIKNNEGEIVYIPFNVAIRLLTLEGDVADLAQYTEESVETLSAATVSIYNNLEEFKVEISNRLVQEITSLSGNVFTTIDSLSATTDAKIAAEKERAVSAETALNILLGNLSNHLDDIIPSDTDISNKLTNKGYVDSEIKKITDVIPNDTSSGNPLTNEAFVNSSISTSTATFRGTYNLITDLHLTSAATTSEIAAAVGEVVLVCDKNDYAYVQIPTSETATTEILRIERYKYDGTAWGFEYALNNSGFTAKQWAAINSGIVAGLVVKLEDLPNKAELDALFEAKQDKLTFDNTPRYGSNNPVTSGGIKGAVDERLPLSGGTVTGDLILNIGYGTNVSLKANSNRNFLRFNDSYNGYIIGDGNVRLALETGNVDLKHRYTTSSGATDYVIVDTRNIQENLTPNLKTLNGTSIVGTGDIDIKDVYLAMYRVTPYSSITEAYWRGKAILVMGFDGIVYFLSKITLSEALFTHFDQTTMTVSSFTVNTSNVYSDITSQQLQENLVSGENIKTINNNSILGSGDIALQVPIDSSNRLDADYVDDRSSLHKFVSTEEKAKWDAKLPLSGGTMTGDIDLNGNALLVRKSGDDIRNGIRFTGEGVREGIYVGNPNMRLFLEADPNLDLIHKKGGDFYNILDTNNVATKGNIYPTTWGDTLDNIINAVNAGKIVILKRDITYNEQKYSPTYVLNCFVKRVSDDYITECRFYARLEDNVVAEIACKRGPTWVDNGVMQLQENLVSGTNIKTINGNSVLGSGDIDTQEVFVGQYGQTSYTEILLACYNFNSIWIQYGSEPEDRFALSCNLGSGNGGFVFYRIKPERIEWFRLDEHSGYSQIYSLDIQSKLTFDNTPTSGSTNPVTSDGIKTALDNKQDLIEDLSTIRSGAAAGATAYQKPSSGIPASDIAAGVIPDVSNFITNSVNNLVNYYVKSDTYTRNEVKDLIGSIQHFHYEIYPSLADITTPESNVLYLIGPKGTGTDLYEEYVYPNNTQGFTKIGDTSIDLSGYATIQALNSALQQFAQDLQTELNNYALKSQIKTVNENSLIGSGDVSIHPEIVNLTDGEHSSGYYEDLMRTVGKLKLNTPQIFLYTAYNNNHIATTAMCFSTCTNTESPTTNAVIKQTLFLGTFKSVRTLSNTVSGDSYQVVDNWTQILDIKQSDLDSKVSRAGSSMTGNLNMDYHELQVSANRNGIKFENNATGILVGNGNMYTTIQSDDADLKHRKGSTDYTILDTSNVKTINGTSINGSGDIDVNNVFWVEYYTTPFADILAAYNAGKVLFANYAGYKFVNIGAATDNDNVTTFVFSLINYDGNNATVVGFTVSLDGGTTVYSNINATDIQTLINTNNKLSADLVDDSSTTHKFVTSAQTETWNTVTEKAPLPFVVNVGIDPAGYVTSISHTISEINAAYSANKQLRLKCFNAQQNVWFEEDLTRINQSAGSYVYVSHTVTDDGTHYIITIYDDSGTTKARFETVDDKAYAKYNDVLINSITPTIASSTVTIDGYTLRPSEETFVVKPYQKIAFSDTESDCHLYIIDATNPSAKTVISSKNHLIIWDNQSDTDITIQVGISNDAPGTLNVSTYWRGVDNVFVAEYNVTSISEIQSAVDSGRVVMCRAIESGNIVYYQLSQSSSASFTFFRFVGARYYRITLNKSTGVWSTSDDYLQSTSNRDSSIDSSASTTHYPSTKAVYDFVIDEINKLGEIVTVGATSDVGDVGSTATLTIKVAGSVVAQGTGTVTATISRGQEYVVEAERVYDYITPAPQTFTAANPARTVTMNYTYIPRDTITINQTESDEHAMITGNVQGNVIKAIRNASHLYLGTQTETGNQLICQLQDLDGTKYSDGTSAALDGSEGDQWLKLPVFWWKVTPIGTADADGAYDEYSFSFAFAGEPDLTWKKWEGDTNLLGAKKMYVSDGKGYSRSGVIGTANFTQATGNGYASARGTGYSCVTWEWQWMMCILFYAWYGRMNSQTQCGAGSNTNTRTLGTKDSLGMTDTTSSNGSADNTKFWGIENWWGDIAEWIGNVTMQGYVLTLTDMNTKQSRTVSGWYQFGGTGGYASRFKVTENIDFIPTAKNGTDSTCYCDWVNGNSGSRVVFRSSYYANTSGGVAYVYANVEPSNAVAYIGSRLAFNGAIVEAESVAAYKAALSV